MYEDTSRILTAPVNLGSEVFPWWINLRPTGSSTPGGVQTAYPGPEVYHQQEDVVGAYPWSGDAGDPGGGLPVDHEPGWLKRCMIGDRREDYAIAGVDPAQRMTASDSTLTAVAVILLKTAVIAVIIGVVNEIIDHMVLPLKLAGIPCSLRLCLTSPGPPSRLHRSRARPSPPGAGSAAGSVGSICCQRQDRCPGGQGPEPSRDLLSGQIPELLI